MAFVPVIQGSLKTNVSNMIIGDYIYARYTTTAVNAVGTFSELGTVDVTTVSKFDVSSNLDGYICLVKVDNGILMSCFPLLDASYKDINSYGFVQGNKITINNKDFIARIPCVAELDKANSTMNGVQSITDIYSNFECSGGDLAQEINKELKCFFYDWGTSGAPVAETYEAISNTSLARLILMYPDNNVSTDVFH